VTGPEVPAPWPPIIRDATLPRAILWRDRICTAAMWLLLLWSCRSVFHRLWDASRILLLEGRLEFVWAVGWMHLRHHFTLIGLLALWASIWTIVTLRRRDRSLHLPQPPVLTLEEEARRIQGTPADLSAWRKLKISVAHLDSQGKVSVLPKKPEGNQ